MNKNRISAPRVLASATAAVAALLAIIAITALLWQTGVLEGSWVVWFRRVIFGLFVASLLVWLVAFIRIRREHARLKRDR